MQPIIRLITAALCLSAMSFVYAAETIQIDLMDSHGKVKPIGTILLEDTPYGVLLTPNLTDLKPGLHGFHVHEHPDCNHVGQAAGSHLDPDKTGKHLGPYNDKGHLGDLPALYVDTTGKSTLPVLAPRLTTSTLKNHALMIHAGGDNYSDTPKLGGGGDRIACGIVK